MITVLLLIAPIPLFIAYLAIVTRIKRRKQPPSTTQFPTLDEKPYEPADSPQANAFLQRFPLTTQLYLRQQWGLARFGFLVSLWILTIVLCGSIIPPLADKLPINSQRAWLSFVTAASAWGSGLTALVGIFAAIFASVGIVGTTGAFHRTRPISLRVIYWGRILPALTALLLSAVASIAISFTVLRVNYGPVWNSVPTSATLGDRQNPLILFDSNETQDQAVARRLSWLAQNPAPRIFASALTSMFFVFSIFVAVFCQPFGATRKFNTSAAKWIVPLITVGTVFVFNAAKDSSATRSVFSQFADLLFYNAVFQDPPAWRFLPVPIILSIALLFLSAFLYRRRDI